MNGSVVILALMAFGVLMGGGFILAGLSSLPEIDKIVSDDPAEVRTFLKECRAREGVSNLKREGDYYVVTCLQQWR